MLGLQAGKVNHNAESGVLQLRLLRFGLASGWGKTPLSEKKAEGKRAESPPLAAHDQVIAIIQGVALIRSCWGCSPLCCSVELSRERPLGGERALALEALAESEPDLGLGRSFCRRRRSVVV